MVFPNPLLLTGCNLYLRANPGRLATEPYTGGMAVRGARGRRHPDNLIEAVPAKAWMEREVRRINEAVQLGSGMVARMAGCSPPACWRCSIANPDAGPVSRILLAVRERE